MVLRYQFRRNEFICKIAYVRMLRTSAVTLMSLYCKCRCIDGRSNRKMCVVPSIECTSDMWGVQLFSSGFLPCCCPGNLSIKWYGPAVLKTVVCVEYVDNTSMELSPSWGATSCAPTQEFSNILWHPKEGSLRCSQEASTGPYPDPDQSTPYHPILSMIYFNIIHPLASWSF
jgi:hypothetical protein